MSVETRGTSLEIAAILLVTALALVLMVIVNV